MGLIEIKCPMCKGAIWLEQSTGKVVDHKSADQQKVSFDGFMKEQQERKGKWDDKLHKAKDDTVKRRAEIEERFKQARDDPDSLQGEVESPFKWD
jgi:hypothetical protein